MTMAGRQVTKPCSHVLDEAGCEPDGVSSPAPHTLSSERRERIEGAIWCVVEGTGRVSVVRVAAWPLSMSPLWATPSDG
jgi:hypothetical protein